MYAVLVIDSNYVRLNGIVVARHGPREIVLGIVKPDSSIGSPGSAGVSCSVGQRFFQAQKKVRNQFCPSGLLSWIGPLVIFFLGVLS